MFMLLKKNYIVIYIYKLNNKKLYIKRNKIIHHIKYKNI